MPNKLKVLVWGCCGIAAITYWRDFCFKGHRNLDLWWKVDVLSLLLVLGKLVLFYPKLFWNVVSRLERKFVRRWLPWLWPLPHQLLHIWSLVRCNQGREIFLRPVILNPWRNRPWVFDAVWWRWREQLVVLSHWPVDHAHHDLWIGPAEVKELLPLFTLFLMYLGAR